MVSHMFANAGRLIVLLPTQIPGKQPGVYETQFSFAPSRCREFESYRYNARKQALPMKGEAV